MTITSHPTERIECVSAGHIGAVAKAAGIELPSLMSLQVFMTVNDQLLAQGTGFIVVYHGQPYLVTNRHNVTGRNNHSNEPLSPTAATPDTIHVMHNLVPQTDGGSQHSFEWESRAEPLYGNDEGPLWLEHPVHSAAVDVVALRLRDVNGVTIAAYPVHTAPQQIGVGVSQELSIVGFPFGATAGGSMAVWTRGTIASEPNVDWEGLPRFLIDARTRPGQSGSAVILHSASGITQNTRGMVLGTPSTQLVGVYSGRINSQSDLGVVWKSYLVGEILSQVASSNELSPLTELT